MKFIVFSILFFSCSLVYSQDNLNDNKLKLPNYDPRPISSVKQNIEDLPLEIKKSINNFFKEVISKNVEKAYEELTKNSFITTKADQYKLLIDQTKSSFKLYGEIISFDFVNSEKATPGYYKVRYLANHAEYPTRWIFTYYNSPKFGWIVLNIKFDDLPDFLFTGD